MEDLSSDDIWKRNEVESPCVKVCVIHQGAGLCVGCHRTLDEIARWSRMTADERRTVIAALPDRAGRLKTRRGGRAARVSGT